METIGEVKNRIVRENDELECVSMNECGSSKRDGKYNEVNEVK